RAVAAVEGVAVPSDVPALLERLCGVALAVLRRGGAQDAVLQTATGTVVATSHDAGLLRGWLRDGGPAGRLAPTQRWDAIVRLATLGEDVDGLVHDELRRDGSSAARLAALTASAARPESAAKASTLDRLTAEDTSNREIAAVARGLWSPEQRELVDPLVTAYLERAPVVARRGQALALVVGRATPRFRWDDSQLAALEHALGGPGLPP